MDIQLEKKELIKLLQETENPSIIKSIQKIFQKYQKDWWDDLSNSAKEGIKEGIEDIKNGRVHSYEEVKKELGWK
jgi:predicted transcriptional regulator